MLFRSKLLDKYNIDTSGCVFIDDNMRNIEAAKKLGIPSIHFTNADALWKELVNMDSRIAGLHL